MTHPVFLLIIKYRGQQPDYHGPFLTTALAQEYADYVIRGPKYISYSIHTLFIPYSSKGTVL